MGWALGVGEGNLYGWVEGRVQVMLARLFAAGEVVVH
jgi:hypothetical protein